jgi:hypothetical protein
LEVFDVFGHLVVIMVSDFGLGVIWGGAAERKMNGKAKSPLMNTVKY